MEKTWSSVKLRVVQAGDIWSGIKPAHTKLTCWNVLNKFELVELIAVPHFAPCGCGSFGQDADWTQCIVKPWHGGLALLPPSQLFAESCWAPEWDVSFLPSWSPCILSTVWGLVLFCASCGIKNKSMDTCYTLLGFTETMQGLQTCHQNSKQTGKQGPCLDTSVWDESVPFPTVGSWDSWGPRENGESKLSPRRLRKVKGAAVVSITEVKFRGRRQTENGSVCCR